MTVVGPVELGPIAHGGHCVARVEGKVVFVRHGLPGELVTVRLTQQGAKFDRGDVAEVLRPSPDRVTAPCPVSGPGGCGGCDFQHVSPAAQRELKRRVVAEQLDRLAGVEWSGRVEELPGGGQGWRTRMRYVATGDGRLGMRGQRSHALVALPEEGCRIAHPEVPLPEAGGVTPGEELLVAGRGPNAAVLLGGKRLAGPELLEERAAGRVFRVAPDGFWQVHPAAAETLLGAVLEGLRPRAGERALDLYCGVGLFAAGLVDAGCAVTGVEGSKRAVRLARENVPEAGFRAGAVEQVLKSLPKVVDLVVLDPPREGSGRGVVSAVAKRGARAVAYVACDPAALARDLAWFAADGYRVESLRAFDLFPMTHHVECVAILTPARSGEKLKA